MGCLAVAVAGCGVVTDPVASSDPAGPGLGDAAAPTMAVSLEGVSDLDTIVAAATGDHLIARSAPDDTASPVVELDNPRTSGAPLVLQVLDATAEPGWLKVLLPVRPNGTAGWVRVDDVSLTRNPWRMAIDVSDFELVVWRHDVVVVETTVAIGTGATPTPIGSFYLTDLVQPRDPNGPYGSYAFGLSGFSETLTEFNGGDGAIGIHGTDDPSSLGTTVSHGCVRVDNAVIEELVGLLPLGTPVVISA